MATDKKPSSSEKNNVSISGDVNGVVIVGNENTVNQTIIQKFVNIFKSDAETLEQRNRRILLNHVENAWIKGVLDASLHGAALLDLGIKQDPEAVTKYPWAIKKESTDETLPTGTSMLEIFDSIGMGRSLLILGAPGSGKTTMLLELTRGLIARAREDVTQPIPMVFNLASWTEKLTLADWLAQELNNLYSVPRKTAPDWVKGNKLLLLLDGLDEVRQDSRAKCVDAINEFRKQNGLTSLAVCSRSQDYADHKAKLSFEGAIEVQPLTQEQITEFFNRFGDEIAGIKQALEKDSELREMAETPLFLSIILIAYREKKDVEILVSGDERARRKHLFDTYIERMFERPRVKIGDFKKQDVLRRLSWLSQRMVNFNSVPFTLERMQPVWLSESRWQFFLTLILHNGVLAGLAFGLLGDWKTSLIAVAGGSFMTLLTLLTSPLTLTKKTNYIKTTDRLSMDLKNTKKNFLPILGGSVLFGIEVLMIGLICNAIFNLDIEIKVWVILSCAFLVYFFSGQFLFSNLKSSIVPQSYPGQSLWLTTKNSFLSYLLIGPYLAFEFALLGSALGWLVFELPQENGFGLVTLRDAIVIGGTFLGSVGFVISGLVLGGIDVIKHNVLRFVISVTNLLPWRLVPFLDHCVDLIFLRRVGGGYIFVHRLLMEHFAEMYVEAPTSKGN